MTPAVAIAVLGDRDPTLDVRREAGPRGLSPTGACGVFAADIGGNRPQVAPGRVIHEHCYVFS
jgi:hypothetical protein